VRLGDGRYPTRPRDKVGAIVFVQSVAALFTLRDVEARPTFTLSYFLSALVLWLRRAALHPLPLLFLSRGGGVRIATDRRRHYFVVSFPRCHGSST
jgi:hypothetical protein